MPNWRLLLSARDPGAAENIAELARCALGGDTFEVCMVAAEPALTLLRAEGLPVEAAGLPDGHGPSEAADLLDSARAVAERVRPDAILCGLSGPGAGIDEALIAACRELPSYALQDFWGDVNWSLGRAADLYFVLDADAAALTRARHGVAACVSGMPKYAALSRLDHARLRTAARARYGVADREALVGLFGQPLWHAEAYAEAVAEVAAAAAGLAGARLCFRPHPKDSPEDRRRAAGIAAASGAAFTIDDGPSAIHLLAACDVACTAFSSCGLDAVMLNRASAAPLGGVVYYLPPALRSLCREFAGLDRMPTVHQGVALVADSREALAALLPTAIRPETRAALWRRAREVMPDPSGAAELILGRVAADLMAGSRRSSGLAR